MSKLVRIDLQRPSGRPGTGLFGGRRGPAGALGVATLLACLLGTSTTQAACPVAQRLFVAVDTAAELGGVFVSRNEYLELGSPPQRFQLAGLPPSAALRALHRGNAGDLYFVLDIGLQLDGQFHPAGRLIRWDGMSYAALPPSPLDEVAPLAAYAQLGVARFAVPARDTTLSGGVLASPRDLVYQPDGDAGVLHIERIGEPGDLPATVRVQAMAVLDADTLLLAFNTGFSIDGSHYRRSDLVRYRRSTRSFSLACRLTELHPRWLSVGVTGLAALTLPEPIFQDGFESSPPLTATGARP